MREKNNFSSLTTHPGHCHSMGQPQKGWPFEFLLAAQTEAQG
jgi:hypothetical protein